MISGNGNKDPEIETTSQGRIRGAISLNFWAARNGNISKNRGADVITMTLLYSL
jgi:hypothetical protein